MNYLTYFEYYFLDKGYLTLVILVGFYCTCSECQMILLLKLLKLVLYSTFYKSQGY